MADQVWVTDIYPAREEPLVGVTGMSVAELVKAPVSFEPSLSALPQGVYDTSEPGDTIVVMGAGSIVSVAEELAGLFESAG